VKVGAPLARYSMIRLADAVKGQQSGAATKTTARSFFVILISPEVANFIEQKICQLWFCRSTT
jgi:hypothetical protein